MVKMHLNLMTKRRNNNATTGRTVDVHRYSNWDALVLYQDQEMVNGVPFSSLIYYIYKYIFIINVCLLRVMPSNHLLIQTQVGRQF